MPLAVAAVVNLTAVPMVPDQISCSLVPPPAFGCGVASNAPSQAFLPSPLLSGPSTTQTIAALGSVPFEGTTGDPEPYPKVKVLLASSVRVGSSPLLLTPNLNARR